jgi:SNF family Na+-dependent transporter
VLGLMDQLAGNVLLVGGGLALSIFVGWLVPDPRAEIEAGAGPIRWFFPWRFLLRFVVPPVLAVVLFHSLSELLG